MLLNPAIERLQSISLQLPENTSAPMAAVVPRAKEPITCHVLDTTTGRPAVNINVKLVCCSIPDIHYTGQTNEDGRIMNWSNMGSFVTHKGGVGASMHHIMRNFKDQGPNCPAGSSLWKLEFDTGSYYGLENTFFPVVELTFLVKEGEHFHVPLLLGPYSYTTYRGS